MSSIAESAKIKESQSGYTPFLGRILPFSTVYENEHSFSKISIKGKEPKFGFVNSEGRIVVVDHSLRVTIGSIQEGFITEEVEETELLV